MDRDSLWRDLLSGAGAGIIARGLTHPIDTVKARLQVQQSIVRHAAVAGVRPYTGIASGLTRLVVEEGARGAFRGFGAVLACTAPANALYFASYEKSKTALGPILGDSSTTYMVSGLVAQFFAGLIFTPMDVIKERLQVQEMVHRAQPNARMHAGSLRAAVDIIRMQGPLALFTGYGATLMVWGPYNMIYFPVYEKLKKTYAAVKGGWLPGDKIRLGDDEIEVIKDRFLPVEIAACAMAGSAVSTVATSPMDVIKTRLQALEKQSGGGTYQQVWHGLKADGIAKSLRMGMAARVCTIVPQAAITFFAYEFIRLTLSSDSDMKGMA